MSLYNTLFGVNDDAPILLGMIGVNMEYFDRFRDVYLCNYGEEIRVYTRLGGGNRPDYKETWEKIKSHPNYIQDFDDEFDETYAYIDFFIPEKYIDTAKKMFKEEPYTISEKFEQEIEEMNKPGTPAYERAEKMAQMLVDNIENGNHFIEL